MEKKPIRSGSLLQVVDLSTLSPEQPHTLQTSCGLKLKTLGCGQAVADWTCDLISSGHWGQNFLVTEDFLV